MRRIRNLLIAGILATAGVLNTSAQVRDISVNVSPRVSYNWWNQNIALNNSPFYGAAVGFGFGPFFELRATFDKSINLKNTLDGKSWNPLTAEQLAKLEGMKIDVIRFGGEAKINLVSGYVVSPFITLGAGVQVLDYNPFKSNATSIDQFMQEARSKEQQLYLSAGLGLKLNFTDRVAFTLEGKNIRFNLDENNGLLNPDRNKEAKKWGNWAALASLDFYLGGSNYNTEQRDIYTDGFRGVKFVVEPGMLYTDFAEKTGRTDQWYLGGSAGLDFGSLVGVRAFYYQATKEPNKLSFNFNSNNKIYGAKVVTRLNQPRGIVPYLQLGAGYIDDNNLINTANGKNFDKHNLFALAGAGLELPLSRYIALFGTANAMFMADKGTVVNDVIKPTDITTSMAYTAGVRINIGAPAYVKPAITSVSEEKSINEEATEIRKETAHENIRDEKHVTEEKHITKETTRTSLFGEPVRKQAATCSKEQNMMTKKEFEEMVDRILQKIRTEEELRASSFSKDEMSIITTALANQNAKSEVKSSDNEQLVLEIRNLVKALDRQNRGDSEVRIITQTGADVTPNTTTTVPTTQVAPVQRVDSYNPAPTAAHTQFMKLNRIGLLTGVNLGEGFQWSVGVRGFLQISNTDLDFVPEVMIGFGKKTAFDISANVVYNLPWKWASFRPYAGLGLGLFSHGRGVSFGVNTILGTTFASSKNGEFFVDYSIRNLFKNNQIAVGYRFVF